MTLRWVAVVLLSAHLNASICPLSLSGGWFRDFGSMQYPSAQSGRTAEAACNSSCAAAGAFTSHVPERHA